MKPISVIIFICFCLTSPILSQITVTQSDMPAAGDTLRVSLTNVVPAGYRKTAFDTSWNFAALEALSQRVDTFVSATSTPSAYQIFFVLLGGANLASPKGNNLVAGLPVSQGFTFFKNSSESYSELGSAYTVQGLPLPAKYDLPDKIYQFPVTPGLSWNSSSAFAITVPDMAFYSTQRVRTNLVDGWGSLTTPYGTFQTLRVKSDLIINDSIYLDSLGTGFSINRNITEYKWLAKDKGIPVLEIDEEEDLAVAVYRDIFRMPTMPLTVSLGPDTAVFMGTILTLHASISGGSPPYQVIWNTLDTGLSITVTVQDIQTYSVLVVDALQNFGMAQKVVSVRYPPGINESRTTQLHIFPNPSQGFIRCILPGLKKNAVMEVHTPRGDIIQTLPVHPFEGEFSADLSALPDGVYYIRIVSDAGVFTSKLILVK